MAIFNLPVWRTQYFSLCVYVPGDGELEVKEMMQNIEVLNFHCFYGKELMREFRRIDTDGDRFIR